MRIALVCDWLTTPGGAEQVLLELHRLYPDAPIYTSQYNPRKLTWFQDATVRTGWLQIFPSAFRKILGPLRHLYFAHLDLTAYDLVVSVTGAEAKAVRARRHLCYCHVPTQYYWQMYDSYLQNPGFGFLNPLVRFFFKLFVGPLRRADYRAAQRPDQFLTISTYAAAAIRRYYHRSATIVAPPVDLQRFVSHPVAKTTKSAKSTQSAAKSAKPTQSTRHGFIIACRQVTWKRVDLAISACLEAQLPLTVIGDGPEHAHLVALAAGSPLITFVPWIAPDQLAQHLHSADAFIFPSLEPFGIAAVEALAAGCPVIAYAKGGSRDFIQPGKNGLLFSSQTPAALARALRDFSNHRFNSRTVTASAAPFSRDHFRQGITEAVTKLTKEAPRA